MISVCLASYNGSNYIMAQIDSILKQLEPLDELIISDDGSTDNTIELIKGVNDSRIKLVKNELEKGYSKNFENAILHSKGDVLFLSDQDDLWIEGKVEKMLKQLGTADMVISDAEIVNEAIETISASHFKLRNVKKGFFINFLKTRYIGACMAFKRKILKKVLPFPKNQKLCAHDYWLTLVAEFYYKVELIEEPLIKYRRHSLNASSGGDTSPFTTKKKLLTRIYSFFILILRVGK